MSEPRRDDRDDIIPLPLDDRPAPVDLAALSPEARLATALVMQAQALDGMRRNQAELVRRLSDGGEGAGPLRDALSRFHDRLDEVRSNQRGTADQLRALRRRSRGHMAALALVVAALVSGAAWWIVASLPAPRDDGPLLAAIDAGSARTDEAVSRAVAQSEGRLDGRLAASLAGLQQRLETGEAEARGEIAALAARREELAAELAAAQRREEEAQRAAAATAAEIEALQGDRARLLGENTRLRNQLLEQERGRSELQRRIDELAAQMQAMVPAAATVGVSTGGSGASLAEAVNAALAASGARQARLIEAGGVVDGALRDVMLVRLAADGAPRDTVSADRAVLVADPGGLALLASRGPGPGVPVERVALPAPDLAALAGVGLALPAAAGAITPVRAALDELLAARGYRLEQLAGVEGDELAGLVLEGEGRRIRAARGRVVADGPALLLADGSVTTEHETRPFFHGTLRVALPGADFGAWTMALAGAGASSGAVGEPGRGP